MSLILSSSHILFVWLKILSWWNQTKCYPCHSTANITQEVTKMKQIFEKVFKEEGRRREEENEILKPDFQGSKNQFSAPSYNSFTKALMVLSSRCTPAPEGLWGWPWLPWGGHSRVCRWPISSLKLPIPPQEQELRFLVNQLDKPGRTAEHSLGAESPWFKMADFTACNPPCHETLHKR